MTGDRMNLHTLVVKDSLADLLREMIGLRTSVGKLEVMHRAGATYGEKIPLRTARRNGCPPREATLRTFNQSGRQRP